MATTPTANTHQCLKNGNKAGQMQWHLTSTDMNSNGQKERCKMIEEKTIYHDDQGIDAAIELGIVSDFVEVTVNHGEKETVVRFDMYTAIAFAKEILRKCDEIEKNQE